MEGLTELKSVKNAWQKTYTGIHAEDGLTFFMFICKSMKLQRERDRERDREKYKKDNRNAQKMTIKTKSE